ncbi:MAG TPA: FAD:protein FMN transferase [Bdellovibrionales bacterium]|nr:FAD:protein FMN transferase [Bdellovibrionales bacterium]
MEIKRGAALMGTYVSVAATAVDRATALAASESALRALEAAERTLSTWTPGSELSRVNRARSGETVALSRELFEALDGAITCHRDTSGYFNPAVGALVRLWGLRDGGRLTRPSRRELKNALAASQVATFTLGTGDVTRQSGDAVFEEGGFGKGAALDQAARAVRDARLVLNLGGQILVTDGPPVDAVIEGSGLVLGIERGSLATSGNDKRAVRVAGQARGHILDPTTGLPAADFGLLTVWAESGLRADCLSTALYAMGPARALRWALGRSDVQVLIQSRGARLATCGLKNKIKNNTNVKFICNDEQLETLLKEYDI